ncbi:hypothetical protein HW509_07515 [Asaia spathodeae]|uniref:hypothetical protein n=1 Tax=Asaia spathodeae TaxID=657016 RepID=UPI002FC2C836
MSGDFWSNTISALISGFFGGGIISLITTYWTLKQKEKEEKKLENILVLNTLISIRSELSTVFNRYQNQIGNLLENTPSRNVPPIYIPISGDYFPIYRNNTNIIGKISNEQTIENLVFSYTLSSGLIDSLLFNNSLYEKFTALTAEQRRSNDKSTFDKLSIEIDELKIEIQDYWDKIRISHYELKRIASLAYTGITSEIDKRKNL